MSHLHQGKCNRNSHLSNFVLNALQTTRIQLQTTYSPLQLAAIVPSRSSFDPFVGFLHFFLYLAVLGC